MTINSDTKNHETKCVGQNRECLAKVLYLDAVNSEKPLKLHFKEELHDRLRWQF